MQTGRNEGFFEGTLIFSKARVKRLLIQTLDLLYSCSRETTFDFQSIWSGLNQQKLASRFGWFFEETRRIPKCDRNLRKCVQINQPNELKFKYRKCGSIVWIALSYWTSNQVWRRRILFSSLRAVQRSIGVERADSFTARNRALARTEIHLLSIIYWNLLSA